jgi:endogenous inhibitor of DNA gyrase (YacG/DUF329 family)
MPYATASLVSRTCEQCGAEFAARPSQRGRFCGKRCHGVYIASRREYTVMTMEERFWHFTKRTDSCWLWTGALFSSKYRYGMIYGTDRKHMAAHRFAYELFKGPIPKGKSVCHDCPDGDNPLCVNPDHLFLGSQADNVNDMMKKERHWSQTGSYHPPRTGHSAMIFCAQCGKEVRIPPSRLGRRRYCSKKCKSEWESTPKSNPSTLQTSVQDMQ